MSLSGTHTYARPDMRGMPDIERWNALQARFRRRFERGWHGRWHFLHSDLIDFCAKRSRLALRLLVWTEARKIRVAPRRG